MAITQQDWAMYQQRQTDIKGFLNVLAPFTTSDDQELKKLAQDKVKELIKEVDLDFKEKTIKPI